MLRATIPMTRFKLTAALVLLAAFGVVVLQNAAVTEIQVFAWEFQVSRIVLLTAPAVLGFVIGFLLAKLTGGSSGKS